MIDFPPPHIPGHRQVLYWNIDITPHYPFCTHK